MCSSGSQAQERARKEEHVSLMALEV